MVEISHEVAQKCIDALDAQAERQRNEASKAQWKADQGISDELVYDYTPVAQILRENSRKNSATRDHLISLLNEED